MPNPVTSSLSPLPSPFRPDNVFVDGEGLSALSFAVLLADRRTIADARSAPAAIPFLAFDVSGGAIGLPESDAHSARPMRAQDGPSEIAVEGAGDQTGAKAASSMVIHNAPTSSVMLLPTAVHSSHLVTPGSLVSEVLASSPTKATGEMEGPQDRQEVSVRPQRPKKPLVAIAPASRFHIHEHSADPSIALRPAPGLTVPLGEIDRASMASAATPERRTSRPLPEQTQGREPSNQDVGERIGLSANIVGNLPQSAPPLGPLGSNRSEQTLSPSVTMAKSAPLTRAMNPESAQPRSTAAPRHASPSPMPSSAHSRREALEKQQAAVKVTLHTAEQEIALTARIAGSTGDEAELVRTAQQLLARSGLQLAAVAVVNGRRITRQSRR